MYKNIRLYSIGTIYEGELGYNETMIFYNIKAHLISTNILPGSYQISLQIENTSIHEWLPYKCKIHSTK